MRAMSTELTPSEVAEDWLHSDLKDYCETFLSIRTKDEQLAPFFWNPVQLAYQAAKQRVAAEGKRPRFLVLKYRQGGITTLEQAASFHMVTTTPNAGAVTLAHNTETTTMIFEITQRFYDTFEPDGIEHHRPTRMRQNKKELRFPGLDSTFFIGTAGSHEIGHGLTVNRFHGSEVSRWPDLMGTLKGMGQAVPRHGTIVLETTANGMGNPFHQLWEVAKAGGNEYTPVFLPWFSDPQYAIPLIDPDELGAYNSAEQELIERHGVTPPQIKWRREKIAEPGMGKAFIEQYPEDDITCFLTSGGCYFDAGKLRDLLPVARRATPVAIEEDGRLLIFEQPMPGKTYVVGADVAEGLVHGDFSTFSLLDRQTRKEVAAYRGHLTDIDFARLLARIGTRFNLALLGVERNNHGHSVLNSLNNQLHYPHLYAEVKLDRTTQKETRKLGWHTNAKTKPLMINALDDLIRNDSFETGDPGLLGECLSFIRHEDSSLGASKGCYDDRVIGRAIAEQLLAKPVHKPGGDAKPIDAAPALIPPVGGQQVVIPAHLQTNPFMSGF